jgi:OOP family OmpA-OmpF porin
VAKGYGEADPIAENDSEDGREANRRIEFHLTLPESDYEESAVGPH